MRFTAYGEDVDSIIMGLKDAIKKLKQGYVQDYDYHWLLDKKEVK